MRHRLVAVAPVVAVAFALLLVTCACGAGQTSQTATQVSGVDGVIGRAGPIVARNAVIKFPATRPLSDAAYLPGTDAPLRMMIVNEGSQPDRLLSGSSPVANSVKTTGDTSLPGQQALAVGYDSASTAPTIERVEIVLTGLREPLKPGGIGYQVTLLFERAGPLTLLVPVGNPDESGE